MTTKVMDCDLVVLGAGGSGLVAAVKVSDLTGRKVIVVEKAKKPGGATIFAGVWGELGPVKDSKWHKDAGYKVNDPPDISGQFFDWLVTKGGAEDFFKVAPIEENRWEDIYMPQRQEKYNTLPDPSIGPGKLGSYVVGKMLECCEKAGIQVLTETRAKKFVTNDKGGLQGVLADTNDGQLMVNCKACVIAAGGFGSDYKKLQKYWPHVFNNMKMHCLCPPGMTGDGIDMAEEIGAAIDQTKRNISKPGGFIGDGPLHHPYSYTINSIMGNGMMVSVNLDGKRWKAEGGDGYADLTLQPKGVAYSIADDDIVEELGSQLVPNLRSNQRQPWRIKILSRYREEIEEEVAIDEEGASGNHTKKADTFAELALKMKVDPKTFVETMERYNKFCEDGKDLDFGKPAKYLRPIRKPPFYAFFGHRWRQCTKGRHGICVNSKFEVMNAKGKVMPGLYAAGDNCVIFGGLILNRVSWGSGKPLKPEDFTTEAFDPAQCEGESSAASGKNQFPGVGYPCGGCGPAFISGYYAGMSVSEYLNKI